MVIFYLLKQLKIFRNSILSTFLINDNIYSGNLSTTQRKRGPREELGFLLTTYLSRIFCNLKNLFCRIDSCLSSIFGVY